MYSLEYSKHHMVSTQTYVTFLFSLGTPVENKTKCFDKAADCSFLTIKQNVPNNKTKTTITRIEVHIIVH